MSLPSVEWRYVGTSYVSGTIDAVLNAVYALATGTGYIDGSSRSQGSGSAGTWGIATGTGGITEAIYVTPPSGNAKIIIAGSSGTPATSPTMASPDTYSSGTLMMNIVKNAGAYSIWNSGNPFTSGTNFGYWRILGNRGTNTSSVPGALSSFIGNVYLYESKESIGVFFISPTAGSSSSSYSNGGIAGALWDPESSNSSDVESDGRTYGMITSGHGSIGGGSSYSTTLSSWDNAFVWGIGQFSPTSASTTTLTTNVHNTSRGFIHGHSTGNSSSHCGIFTPGGSAIKTALLMMYPCQVNGGSSLKTPSGKYVRIPLVYKFSDTLDMVGRLREISLVNRGLIGQRHVDGVTTIGYTVGCSDSALYPSDCLLFEY